MKLKKNDYLIGGILLVYCLIGIIPNFNTLDRVANQWLMMSIANTIGLAYLFNNFDTYKSTLKKIFQFKPFIFFLIFVLWGLLSYFYALNQIEVVVKFFTWINIVIGILVFCLLLFASNKSLLLVSYIFSIILIIELYFSYSTFFELSRLAVFNFEYVNLLKGAAGNKNILAISILLKIPFLFYLVSKNKNIFIKIIFSGLITSASFLIFLLSARASILGILMILFVTFIFILIRYIKNRDRYLLGNSFIYLVIPILLSITIFQLKFGSSNNSVSIGQRATSINTQDDSTNQRLRFYKHSANQIFSNPILGVGLGNWKISSIDYDKKDIEGYQVPYHVHNDFLEIGAELGILGFILYLSVFMYMFYYVLKILIYEGSTSKELAPISLVLLLGGIVYFIDANLNFPHARVINQIPFILYIAIFFQLYHKKLKNEKS